MFIATVLMTNKMGPGIFGSLDSRRTSTPAGWIISFAYSKLAWYFEVSFVVLCILARICLGRIASNARLLYELFLYDLCSFVLEVYAAVFYGKCLLFWCKILAGFYLGYRKILGRIFLFIQALPSLNLVERDHLRI